MSARVHRAVTTLLAVASLSSLALAVGVVVDSGRRWPLG
jgi:hypothetical protein